MIFKKKMIARNGNFKSTMNRRFKLCGFEGNDLVMLKIVE